MRKRISQEVLSISIAEHLEEAIIKNVHEYPYNGHMAADKTLQKLYLHFYIRKGISTKVKKLTNVFRLVHYIVDERKHRCL